MDLRYIVLTIIKILISIPTVVLIFPSSTEAAALMGGHLDNMSNLNKTDSASYEYEFDFGDSQELGGNYTYVDEVPPKANASIPVSTTTTTTKKPTSATAQNTINKNVETSEEIPEASPLVVPGYNLPENIFNKGKPFYLEKDPLTGAIDFNTKNLHTSDEYEYIDEEPSKDIYDKSNIDRKDGSLYGSHKPSDVNQLTPNFHDFLNLPVKYNPDKYVYPLISNSYANTKVQGNVNKYHNHKDFATTYKPTISPTYYTTNRYQPPTRITTVRTTKVTSTTRAPSTTTVKTTTEKVPNLLFSAMNHPSFQVFETATDRKDVNDVYFTTKKDAASTTVKPVVGTTTKRTMSLFEQLFGGDYEEDVETTEKPQTPPQLFMNLPSNKNKTPGTEPTKPPSPQATTLSYNTNNVLSGSKMEHEYEYEEYGNEFTATDNIAVESKPNKQETNSKTTTTTKPVALTTTTKTTSKPVSTKKPIDTTKTTTAKPTVTTKAQIIYGQTEKSTSKTVKSTTTVTPITEKVTSLPLGENHLSLNNGQPIIVATQNLREKLNGEKVPKPFQFENKNVIQQHAPSTSNIHIPPGQDTVSFVMGHHQSVEGGNGQYVGSDFKVSPYDHNPFRPLYGSGGQSVAVPPTASDNRIIFQADDNAPGDKNEVSFLVQSSMGPQIANKDTSVSYTIGGDFSGPQQVGSSGNIQPIRNSEASLTIGVPVSGIKVAGQVVDEKLELGSDKVEFPKGTGNKIVFPDDTKKIQNDLIIPPKVQQQQPTLAQPNKDVLNLSSKPMFHQLPSDLTPPVEKVEMSPPRRDRPRPPWDPRPGHFYSGRPEYARPPRPPTSNDIYKRIDNLPNILPQFRPNMKNQYHQPPPHFYNNNGNSNEKGYLRQPLLDRPSNRPIGFFKKLQPPPPPKNLQHIRKVPLELRGQYNNNENQKIRPSLNLDVRSNYPGIDAVEQHLQPQFAEDRISNTNQNANAHILNKEEQFPFIKTPPKLLIANRRNGDEDVEIETLQMIQAKQQTQQEIAQNDHALVQKAEQQSSFNTNLNGKDSIEKPLYVVYPVNAANTKNTNSIKIGEDDDTSNKENVVIGTRAELPLPPSKIPNLAYEPLLSPKNRDDSPILKPHHRPSTYPTKSDFPYHIERPHNENGNVNKDVTDIDLFGSHKFLSNQWNSVDDAESRIVNAGNNKIVTAGNGNQISVTLKTYTDKPIAVAYTPTDSAFIGNNNNNNKEYTEKYSMPNYGSPVIPEIRPGFVENAELSGSEYTVSAVMHAHHQNGEIPSQNIHRNTIVNPVVGNSNKQTELNRVDEMTTHVPNVAQQDFQAPFQASMNLENMSQGWTVVREKNSKSSEDENVEVTTIPVATTSEFDIENFKPQLIGGFKPIYTSIPEEPATKEEQVSERQEK